MTLNGILSESISGFHYLPLPDSSVAIVGPNGVGKSSLIKALQRCIQGDAGNRDERSMVHLDLLLPRNLENWIEENKDPGVIKSIRDLLIARDSFSFIDEVSQVETKDYVDALTTLWRDSVRNIKSEWLFRMKVSEPEETNDAYLNQIVEKHTLWHSYVSVPYSQVPADHEQFSQQYLAEYQANENARYEAYNPVLDGFNFDITSVGNSQTPQWRVDLIFKIPINELTNKNVLTEIAQMMTWPKSLTEAMEHDGQFGFGDYDIDGRGMKQYVRFINGEAWFGINIGITQNSLGFNFVNPDELSWDKVREAAIELIDGGVTFSEGGMSNLALRRTYQEEQSKQTRFNGEQKGVLPIDSTLSFTKEFDTYLKKYSDMASDFFNTFIPGAPRLEFTSNRKEYWITKGLVQIEVRDGYIQYELEELSEAQQRWAKISLLLTAYQYSNLALFIDEPERGIQRKIESTLLDLFEKVDVGATSLPRFFATHSAEIISNCSTVIQISRDTDGIRHLSRVVGSILPKLQELDISQEEFFQSKKLIVLTEGIMDKAMLDGFAFDRFQKEGIEVIHGFGLESWSSYFDSQYLRKSSGAKVVFWADSLDMKKLNDLIQRVIDENIEDKALVAFFTEHIREVVKETWSKVQYDIVVAIIAESIRSKDSKVRIESTGDYDCIMWVTPQILGLPLSTTWHGLINELNAQPRTKIMDSRGKRFKRLVKFKLKIAGYPDGLNINRLKTVCQELEISGQIPSEVNNLIERIIQFAKD